MESAGIFYGHLEHFMLIWYILWAFGNIVVIWYIFPRFGILCQEKSGNPARRGVSREKIINNFGLVDFFWYHVTRVTRVTRLGKISPIA
jgi:hypothetical protein